MKSLQVPQSDFWTTRTLIPKIMVQSQKLVYDTEMTVSRSMGERWWQRPNNTLLKLLQLLTILHPQQNPPKRKRNVRDSRCWITK